MKYVQTTKKKLQDVNYDARVIYQKMDRDFFLNFPAPVKFTIPTDRTIYDNAVQVLAIWYMRGTELVFPNIAIRNPHPITEWSYGFTIGLPLFYIKKNATTVKKAYELGQKLINACISASKIPFPKLELAYKEIIKNCQICNIKAYSPNAKTFFEARAELDVENEIEGMFYLEQDIPLCYTESELSFYAKLFDINLPEWFIKTANIKTKHGFASCPYIDGQPRNSYSSNYAGSLSDDGDNGNHTPLTLLKDAQANKVRNEEVEKKQLTAQVNFFLSQPFQDLLSYLGQNWSYCPECDSFYNLSEGCECGLCPPREEISFEALKFSSKKYKCKF